MWGGPIIVSTDSPTTGLSPDSPVSDGASSGFAVNSDLTCSGCEVTIGPPGTVPRTRNTSPSRRRAPNTNSIWRMLKRSTCATRGSGTVGGSLSCSRSASLIGPAGDGVTAPISSMDVFAPLASAASIRMPLPPVVLTQGYLNPGNDLGGRPQAQPGGTSGAATRTRWRTRSDPAAVTRPPASAKAADAQ